MSNPKGTLRVNSGGKDYVLHLGMSGFGDLQEIHGRNVLEKLQPPEGHDGDWLPELKVVVDMVLIALQRYHSDVADKYLVDDILSENPGILADLVQAAFPDQKAEAGNGKRARKAA